MAQGDFVLYNDFKEQLGKKVHDLVNDTIKMTLHTGYTPDIDAHAVWADVSATEYTTGSGYTAGGKTVTTSAVTQNNTDDRAEWDFDDVTWTSLGALSPATPSHAILWNDTPSSPADPLIGYIELGTTATNGSDYSLTIGANGLLHFT